MNERNKVPSKAQKREIYDAAKQAADVATRVAVNANLPDASVKTAQAVALGTVVARELEKIR